MNTNDLNVISIAINGLAYTLMHGFGPYGLESLLLSGTSQTWLATTHGIDILRALVVNHPAGVLVVKAAQTHALAYGDGASALVLMIGRAMTYVASWRSGERAIRCGRTIARLSSAGILDKIMKDAHTGITIDSKINDVVRSVLSTKFNPDIATILTNTLCTHVDQLFNISDKESFLIAASDDVVHFLDEQTVSAAGLPISSSASVAGLFLRGAILECNEALLDNLDPEDEQLFLFSVLSEHLFNADADVTVCVSSSRDVEVLRSTQQSNIRLFVEKLHQLKIRVVVSARRLAVHIIALCREYSIAIIHCAQVDAITELCRAACMVPLSSVKSLDTNHNDSNVFITGKGIFVRRASLGGGSSVSLGFLRSCGAVYRQMVICAPSEYTCRIHRTALKAAATVIYNWARSGNKTIIYGSGVPELSGYETLSAARLQCMSGMGLWAEQIVGAEILAHDAIDALEVIRDAFLVVPETILHNSNGSNSGQKVKLLRTALATVRDNPKAAATILCGSSDITVETSCRSFNLISGVAACLTQLLRMNGGIAKKR